MRDSFLKLLLVTACVFSQVQAEEEAVNTASKDLTGFNVGVDLMQTWATARNFTNEGWAVRPSGQTVHDTTSGFSKVKGSEFGAAVNLGYSYKFDNNFLVGLSGEVAFGKTEKKTIDNAFRNLSENGKINGCSYALKAKGGYYLSSLKTAAYAIAGVKWQKSDFQNVSQFNFERVKSNKVMPVLGVGLERKLCGGLSACLEYEYFWRKSDVNSSAGNPPAVLTSATQKYKTTLHGNSVRIGCKYYVF